MHVNVHQFILPEVLLQAASCPCVQLDGHSYSSSSDTTRLLKSVPSSTTQAVWPPSNLIQSAAGYRQNDHCIDIVVDEEAFCSIHSIFWSGALVLQACAQAQIDSSKAFTWMTWMTWMQANITDDDDDVDKMNALWAGMMTCLAIYNCLEIFSKLEGCQLPVLHGYALRGQLPLINIYIGALPIQYY